VFFPEFDEGDVINCNEIRDEIFNKMKKQEKIIPFNIQPAISYDAKKFA
jgi:hypothetical protein